MMKRCLAMKSITHITILNLCTILLIFFPFSDSHRLPNTINQNAGEPVNISTNIIHKDPRSTSQRQFIRRKRRTQLTRPGRSSVSESRESLQFTTLEREKISENDSGMVNFSSFFIIGGDTSTADLISCCYESILQILKNIFEDYSIEISPAYLYHSEIYMIEYECEITNRGMLHFPDLKYQC